VFFVKAHSFQQQARLAITLAWVAGYTNIVSILACGHVTSHVSGTTSDLGRAVAEGVPASAAFLGFLLVAFGVGAMVSGLSVELGRRRRWESIYVLPMVIEAGLLTGFAIGVEVFLQDSTNGARPPRPPVDAMVFVLTGLAAAAMGVQNATITRISSGVVRTTHVTGVLTDLGLEIAGLLGSGPRGPGAEDRRPGSHLDAWMPRRLDTSRLLRPALLASILVSFGLGAALGTLGFEYARAYCMFPPVLFLLWIIYQDLTRPIAEVEPSSLVAETGLEMDDRLAVYRLKRRAERVGGRSKAGRAGRVLPHRFPNLEDFHERLSPAARVVVLDLMGVPAIDANSALELAGLIERLRRGGRTLLVSGLDHAQVEQLRRSGVGSVLSPEQVLPDLELAVARGMVLLSQHGRAAAW